ncbi:MAG TPA: cupin domain-containing protein [Acidimicrobiales bacterium]|nr:cupin domain-containing protein [Acidimicrobiales bacterium]
MTTELFQEPASESERAGLQKGKAQLSNFEKFLVSENIPVHRGIGFRDVRDLELGAWDRLGGRGAYMELSGLDGIKSMFVLEIPGGGVLNPERHLYHAFYLVLEGRGTTETWIREDHKQLVEWQPGSLFYLPPNVHHRLVNATNERVVIIAATNAPGIFNIFGNTDFIFDNDFAFPEHYREEGDFYKYDDQIYAIPTTKRAQARTNFYPDIINSELPLDNQRTPGFRRVQPAWQGFRDEAIGTFIAQYPPGRYSRAHYHTAHAVLVCLRGEGYTFNWPRHLGLTPWKDGHGDQVNRIDYGPGGLVSAAPGGGDWFHQHFAVSADPFRVFNMWGGPLPENYRGFTESGAGVNSNISLGGHAIGFAEEDPYVRETFEAGLAKSGLSSTMPEELYTKDV